MDNGSLVQALFIGSLVLSISGGAAVLGGASVYDFKQIRSRKRISRAKAKPRSKSPSFSVIIYAEKDKADIEKTVSSVITSSHRKYQIIIVDNNSQADLKGTISKFKKKHPKKIIRLVTKRRKTAEKTAIKSAFRYAKGDIITILRPDNFLSKHTLKNTAQVFAVSGAEAVIPASWHEEYSTDVNLLAQFKDIGLSNGLKTLSLITKTAGGTGFGIFYKKVVLSKKPRPYQYIYAANVIILNSPLSGVKKALGAYRKRSISDFYIKVGFLVWLFKNLLFLWRYALAPLFLGYGLYLALISKYTALLGISWLLLAFFLVFSILGTEQLGPRQKLKYMAYIPVAYILFFVVAFADPISRLLKIAYRPIKKLLPDFKFSSLSVKKAAASK